MRAFITGITGQDGSYLAELLLEKGYEVHGMVRRSSSFNTGRIDHIRDQITLHYGDMTDSLSLSRLISEILPDEVYNLAAQSHVGISFEMPDYTADCTGIGVLRLLEAVRRHCPWAKFYQASTSEMFGGSEPPQNEHTRFLPRSPYAFSKVFAHNCVSNYREAYGLHASCGILFNHESHRRGLNFVTSKVCKAASRAEPVVLGNLDAYRDWGHAKDYVRAMWMMLQQDYPDDYVIATGVSRSVKDLCRAAYGYVRLDWRDYVSVSDSYTRPLDVDHLAGDPKKANEKLGWRPEIEFFQLVAGMVDHFGSSDDM